MRPNDPGPIYTETDLSRFPVEPFNTASNLIFLLIFLFWLRKIHGHYREHPLLTVALPILLIGFCGGTLFHATRSHRIWLILDFMPIFILIFLAAYAFWRELKFNAVVSFLLVFVPAILPRILMSRFDLPWQIRIPVGYTLLALVLLMPMVIHCYRAGWRNFKFLILAVLSFGAAIFCRSVDGTLGAELLPMGTHFIWHLHGGAATFLIFWYIYESQRKLGDTLHEANHL